MGYYIQHVPIGVVVYMDVVLDKCTVFSPEFWNRQVQGRVQSTSLKSSLYPLRVSLLHNWLLCTCMCIIVIIIKCRLALHAIIQGCSSLWNTDIGRYICTTEGCSTTQKQPRESTASANICALVGSLHMVLVSISLCFTEPPAAHWVTFRQSWTMPLVLTTQSALGTPALLDYQDG